MVGAVYARSCDAYLLLLLIYTGSAWYYSTTPPRRMSKDAYLLEAAVRPDQFKLYTTTVLGYLPSTGLN